MRRPMFEMIIPADVKKPTIRYEGEIREIVESAWDYMRLTKCKTVKEIQEAIVRDLQIVEETCVLKGLDSNDYPYILVCHRTLSDGTKEVVAGLAPFKTDRPINWLD